VVSVSGWRALEFHDTPPLFDRFPHPPRPGELSRYFFFPQSSNASGLCHVLMSSLLSYIAASVRRSRTVMSASYLALAVVLPMHTVPDFCVLFAQLPSLHFPASLNLPNRSSYPSARIPVRTHSRCMVARISSGVVAGLFHYPSSAYEGGFGSLVSLRPAEALQSPSTTLFRDFGSRCPG